MSKLGQEGSKGRKAMQLLEPGLKLATIACRRLGNRARLESYSVLCGAVGTGKGNKRESVSLGASSNCSSRVTGRERDARELLCARSPWPALPRPLSPSTCSLMLGSSILPAFSALLALY